MKIPGDIMWGCSCGHVFYGEEPPEECEKCNLLDSFMIMPEEIVKLRESEMLEEKLELEDIKQRNVKLSNKKNSSSRNIKRRSKK